MTFRGTWIVTLGLCLMLAFAGMARAQSSTATVEASADTYLRRGAPNTNEGVSPFLRVRKAGQNRALVRFDQQGIEDALGGGELISATLELDISGAAGNWGPGGREIALHRMNADWAQGNGAVAGLPGAPQRGTGAGATWNCAIDTDIANHRPDCAGATAWEPGKHGTNPWEAVPTATAEINNGQSGTVSFDVTLDVVAFLNGTANYGWALKHDSHGSGFIRFDSIESGNPPRLVLEFEDGALASGVIGPGGGTITIDKPGDPLDGAAVIIPANALTETIEITLSEAATDVYPEVSPDMEGLSPALKIEPSGTIFNVPATVVLPISHRIFAPTEHAIPVPLTRSPTVGVDPIQFLFSSDLDPSDGFVSVFAFHLSAFQIAAIVVDENLSSVEMIEPSDGVVEADGSGMSDQIQIKIDVRGAGGENLNDDINMMKPAGPAPGTNVGIARLGVQLVNHTAMINEPIYYSATTPVTGFTYVDDTSAADLDYFLLQGDATSFFVSSVPGSSITADVIVLAAGSGSDFNNCPLIPAFVTCTPIVSNNVDFAAVAPAPQIDSVQTVCNAGTGQYAIEINGSGFSNDGGSDFVDAVLDLNFVAPAYGQQLIPLDTPPPQVSVSDTQITIAEGSLPVNSVLNINATVIRDASMMPDLPSNTANLTEDTAATCPAPAQIASFVALPSTITQDESSQLSYETIGASDCSIVEAGLPTVPLDSQGKGNVQVAPRETTTYTLSCNGPIGAPAVMQATVTVNQFPLSVEIATIDKTIRAPMSTSLEVTSTGWVSCTMDQGIGNVTPGQAIMVSPIVTTTYQAECTGLGGPLNASVTVGVIPPAPTVIRIDPRNLSGVEDGTLWTQALADLQVATQLAQAGDELWIAATGRYVGPDPILGLNDPIIDAVANVSYIGGFDGLGGGLESAIGDRADPLGAPTVLDADYDNDGVTDRCGLIHAASNTTFDGLLVTSGDPSGFFCDLSGFLIENAANVVIRNARMENLSGAGMKIYDSSVVLENTRLEGNIYGGIQLYGSDLEVYDSTISGNGSANGGSGIRTASLRNDEFGNPYYTPNTLLLENVTLAYNESRGQNGGALHCEGDIAFTADNVAFVGNEDTNPSSGSTFGGAIYINSTFGEYSPVVRIANSVFYQNRAGESAGFNGGSSYGGAIVTKGFGVRVIDLTLVNTTFLDNTSFFPGPGGGLVIENTNLNMINVSSRNSALSTRNYGLVQAQNAADWSGFSLNGLVGDSITLNDSCHVGATPGSTIIDSVLLGADPFVTADLVGEGNVDPGMPDGIPELYLNPASPCLDLGDDVAADAVFLPLQDWRSLTTQTSGALDSSPVDAGRHYQP